MSDSSPTVVKPEVTKIVIPGLKPVAERLESVKKLLGHMQTYIQNLEKGEEGALLVLRFNEDNTRVVANPKAQSIGVYDADGIVLAVHLDAIPELTSAMVAVGMCTSFKMGQQSAVDAAMNALEPVPEPTPEAPAAPPAVVDDSQEDDSRDDSRPAHLREE
jgi:hypothetical protein